MDRGQFLAYIDHFNHKRYDAVMSYFAPDVKVEYFTNLRNLEAPARTLHGLKEFIDSYRTLHEHVREVMELRDFLASENLLAAELYTEFHCLKDHPAFSTRPLKKGDVVIMTNWVIYNLVAGKIKHIRIAHFRIHDPKTAKFPSAGHTYDVSYEEADRAKRELMEEKD